jgi:hypothetical protein
VRLHSNRCFGLPAGNRPQTDTNDVMAITSTLTFVSFCHLNHPQRAAQVHCRRPREEKVQSLDAEKGSRASFRRGFNPPGKLIVAHVAKDGPLFNHHSQIERAESFNQQLIIEIAREACELRRLAEDIVFGNRALGLRHLRKNRTWLSEARQRATRFSAGIPSRMRSRASFAWGEDGGMYQDPVFCECSSPNTGSRDSSSTRWP